MSLKERRDAWEKGILNKALAKNKERRESFKNSSGLEAGRLYTPEDLSGWDYERQLGYPGLPPFTRGVQPTMYRGQFWTMRQYAGFGTAEESNKRYRFLLEKGTTGLSVAFDLPTQMGYDSDHAMSKGEVGKTGVAIDSIADMETLFNGIPLDKVSTSMTINSTASILLALYIAVAEKQGVGRDKIRGTVQNDVLKEYIARGTYMLPPDGALRVITDIFEYCTKEVPNWNTISISGYHIREAGSTAVQEVAFTLADGIAYVQAALDRGLDVDSFAGQLSFFFNAHNNLLEEVAKFRAARRLWGRIMKERFAAKSDRSCMLRFHTQTGGSTLTAQQPLNNVVRVALQALSAVLGGTQSLHTNSFDEALALPTESSARLALRTQQVIANESGVADSVDPLAGSYLIESWTDAIEKGAMDYIKRIDEMGGMVKAIEKGFPQKEIQQAAYDYQRAVERKEQIVVGVNEFAETGDARPEILRIDAALEKKQKEKLAKLKAERSREPHQKAMQSLAGAVKDGSNVMPFILDAVRAYATLGEVSDALRARYGAYQETVYL